MTDDHGAGALAERLHQWDSNASGGGCPSCTRRAAAILGEQGRFLPDGWPTGSLAELMELRTEVERLRAALTNVVTYCDGREAPLPHQRQMGDPGWRSVAAIARAALSPEPEP